MADDPDNAPIDPASSEVWHLWFVLFPRRSITGKLVHGLVWRRRNGPGWIYKRFTEADPQIPAHSKRDGNNAQMR